MAKAQRLILVLGVAVFLVMGVYPPWEFGYPKGYPSEPTGYGPIWSPPDAKSGRFHARIDIDRLFVQWAMVAAATGIASAVARKSEE